MDKFNLEFRKSYFEKKAVIKRVLCNNGSPNIININLCVRARPVLLFFFQVYENNLGLVMRIQTNNIYLNTRILIN